VPLASCASLLSSLPSALTTELGGVELEGTFSLTYDVDIDVAHLDKTHVKLDVKNDCRVKKVPRELSPGRFRSIWTREVKGPDGTTMQIQTGPGAPNWVPYGRIPRFMEIAVLVCEDGGFYRHRGFDFRAIEKAIRADVEAGRFVRGASTISMQLAKNLYLGGEKTLSRKIQEAFFTMVLEQELTKQELMELYLNIVELGPGIFGIQAAADYYFASDASSLTLAQSLYLASILPDPTRQHFQPDGSVRKGWADYLKKLMHIARSVDRITDEELAAGLEEEIAFRRPGAGSVEAGADAETPLDEPIPEGVPTELGP
jgi:membrane peptidoglycan carboxypeptidase